MKINRISKAIFRCVLLVSIMAASGVAHSALRIFACEPEWAALAEEIGGDRVKVFTATTPFQDAHHIEARPSLIAKVRRADMLICTGAELEVGWLPLLLRQSGNDAIQIGQPGYFLAAEVVDRLEVPERLDRSEGDIHAAGNPHVHLDPRRLLLIAQAFTERLTLVDPDNADWYRARTEDFGRRWQQAIDRWQAGSSQLQGESVVVYHTAFSYLLDWLGIKAVADLEPKPGLPPTTAHLAKVLATVKSSQPRAILVASFQDDKAAAWLSDRSGLPVIRLPFTVGGDPAAKDLFGLFEITLSLLQGLQSSSRMHPAVPVGLSDSPRAVASPIRPVNSAQLHLRPQKTTGNLVSPFSSGRSGV